MLTWDQEIQAGLFFATATGLPFEWQSTGGGCSALEANITDTHYLMVTHAEDASIPEFLDPHCVGEYVNDDAINYWYFPNRVEAVKFLITWGSNRGAV